MPRYLLAKSQGNLFANLSNPTKIQVNTIKMTADALNNGELYLKSTVDTVKPVLSLVYRVVSTVKMGCKLKQLSHNDHKTLNLTTSCLHPALNSNEHSSLDPLTQLRKNREQSRLTFGSRAVANRFNSGVSAADVITKAGYFLSQPTNTGSPPPLQGTVRPLNLQQGTEFDNMAGKGTRSNKDSTLTVNAADYKKMEQEIKQLKKDVGKMPVENKQLKEANDKLVDENTNLRVKVADLLEQINKMRKKRGRKGVVNRKSEQNEDVKEAIDEYVKSVLFRTVKFAQSGDQLTNATKLVWKGIKEKKKLEIGEDPLTEMDFCEIYESHVATCLSLRRQYVQTQTQKAAEGTINLCWLIVNFA